MARNRVRPLLLLLLLLLLLPTCELKSRQKKNSLALSFSKISLTRATNNFFFSLFSFSQGKIKKFCLKTQTRTRTRAKRTRFWFALVVCFTRDIEKERQLSRGYADRTKTDCRTLPAQARTQSRDKNSKTERERGVLLRREFKKIQERNARQRRVVIVIKRKVTWSK